MNNLMTQSWVIDKNTGFTRLATAADIEQGRMAGLGGPAGAAPPAADEEEEEEKGPGMDLTEFDAKVAEVRKDMESIATAISSLASLHQEAKAAVRSASVVALHKRMDDDVGTISRLAKAIRQRIEGIQEENEANRKYPRCGAGSATDRHRTSVTMTLGKKLKDLMGEFMDLRNRMAEDHRSTVERRVYIVTGEKLPDEDVDRIIETGQSENFIQAAISAQGQSAAMEDVVAEIQERHNAVMDITQQLQELHQMFLDMATMVEAQGEMLDSIESHVGEAVEQTSTAKQQLQTAVVIQQNTRKWYIIGGVAFLVILLIIIIPLVSSAMK
ncbi:hypothetical protein CLOM_g8644 [Closterium sp. NIES-68]|nr:hypothetical protein CLOM_g8644 [Closterium sp. NIES-68]GJP67386.1 hypothetical protein CLOP_g24205 [Closterium sp. NIES-67]